MPGLDAGGRPRRERRAGRVDGGVDLGQVGRGEIADDIRQIRR
eukprot:gene42668-52927_t